ncbi:hypothetical protein [Alienimonas californiensis]|uniref:Uncharacterized protein n=1 Tax=Alienimonas californiensis TaxID=2527989 RepID=A0A517P4K4_9PLAN|nr:hypothetical protein [Alienimonas californiensis]QDT14304.1 hypothetical protein CA12_03760 [Alienimonas californiensis]
MTAPHPNDDDDDDFPLPDRSADLPDDGEGEDDPFADAPPERNPFDLGEDELPPPPPPADPFGTPDPDAEPTDTYSLGEATVPPKWGVDLNEAPAERPAKRRPRPAAPAAKPVAPVVDDEDEDFGDAPPARTRSGGKAGPAKPKLRDWLEERCKKEAKMYALGAAVLAPVGLAAVGLTWLVLAIIVPADGVIEWLLAAIILAALFWVNKQAGDARTIRVHVEPGDRNIKPVTVDVPRGSGLTWLMYLTGSRDLPGILQFLGTVTLFGPRLCDLAYQMGRTAQELWTIDVDAIADPVKTLVRADGKVSFAAFFEAHNKLSPQGLVDRLGKIDGVLFLPTSQPPGLCVSNAMKDEFAAWRSKWQERRTAGDRLFD